MTKTLSDCTLCGTATDGRLIADGEKSFCCHGCHAVYNILQARQELSHFEDSPVFQQALRAGLISNTTLLERIRERSKAQDPDEEQHKIYLEITDLWCPSCAHVIQWVVLNVKGVSSCIVDYATDIAVIQFSPLKTSKEAIFSAIKGIGYHPVALEDRVDGRVSRILYLRFVIAAFCALNIMMFSYPIYASYFDSEPLGFSHLFVWLSWVVSLPVVTFCAWPLFRHAWTGARLGFWGMESLVSIAILSSFGYSTYDLMQGGTSVYFDALSVIVTFVLLGKIIETRAKFSVKESLMQLARYLPRRARRRGSDGVESFVPIKDVSPGDLLVALIGEKIVLEGIVVEGQANVDQSVMTGESIPVVKTVGSEVLSGTVVNQGKLVYRVTTTQEQSLLQQVVSMVEHDLRHKGRYVRASDVVSRWFVPVVLAIAFLTAVYIGTFGIADSGRSVLETALLRCMAILLISCPCAIGIAGPLAESLLMNSLAGAGVIIRNRACLRHLGAETCVVFDKTGTITKGHFRVQKGLELLNPEQRQVIKGLTSQSVHPLSTAIAMSIEESAALLEESEEVVGRGMRGRHKGIGYYVGSEAFLRQHGVQVPAALQRTGIGTDVLVADESGFLACIELADGLRKGAVEVVKDAKPAKTYLLSGDSSHAVAAVAAICPFDEWHAGFSPLGKREFIEKLRNQGETVAMLGDGVNDASALAGAHVGVSVVSATDVSIQVSDILLTTDNLQSFGFARRQARRAHRIIIENLVWAFSYNVVGIGLAVVGLLTPIYSAVAMVTSSVMVLLNALRIR